MAYGNKQVSHLIQVLLSFKAFGASIWTLLASNLMNFETPEAPWELIKQQCIILGKSWPHLNTPGSLKDNSWDHLGTILGTKVIQDAPKMGPRGLKRSSKTSQNQPPRGPSMEKLNHWKTLKNQWFFIDFWGSEEVLSVQKSRKSNTNQ